MVYGDLRSCDALCVLEDYFTAEAPRKSVFCGLYSQHRDRLRETVHSDEAAQTNDNPKLVKLYELLSQLYCVNDAKGEGFITARRCAYMAVFAVVWCPSVCPSRSCIVSRRLKISSNFLFGLVAPSL